jgi:hypothetical protein
MNRYQNSQNNNAGGMQGLLNFVQSPRGMDMATGLLAQSGYSPTPTNLGSAFGKANQYATGMQLKRDANELAELQALGSVAKSLKGNKSDFFKQLDMFNEISSIPADQRSAEQNRTLSVLHDKLKDDESIGDFKVYLANKYLKDGKLTDGKDIALEAFILNLDMFEKMFQGMDLSKTGLQNNNNKNNNNNNNNNDIKKQIDSGTAKAFSNDAGVTIYLVNGKYYNADGSEYKTK